MNIRKIGWTIGGLILAALVAWWLMSSGDNTPQGNLPASPDSQAQTAPDASLPPTAAPSAQSASADARDDAFAQRKRGYFDKALSYFSSLTNSTPEDQLIALGIIEDKGDSKRLIKEAQKFLEKYPDNPEGLWMLTRGQLFAAATFPQDGEYQAWLKNAQQNIDKLDKLNYAPEQVPAGTHLLKMELAFLQGKWDSAYDEALKTVELGTTIGETADTYSLLFDVSMRRDKLKEAEHFLDNALAVVEDASKNSYYGLRMFREEAMIIREFMLEKSFCPEDVDKLEKLHNSLLASGLTDPTNPNDQEAKNLYPVIRQWLDYRDAGDWDACLKFLDNELAKRPEHTPRCFFSEAVSAPLRNVYLNMMGGHIAKRKGDTTLALYYYEEALRQHHNDAHLQRLIDEVKKSKR